MANLLTLPTLRTQVRQRADMEDDGNFISDTELTTYINKGIADLFDIVCLADAGKVYVKNAPVLTQVGGPTANGVAGYDLPTDFYKLHSVSQKVGRDYYDYEPINPAEYARYSANPPDKRNGVYTFRFNEETGQKILYVFPEPDEANLAITYIPLARQLTTDTDTWDGYSGWEDFVIVASAIKCLMKEESDPRALIAELNTIKKDIQAHAGYLDTGQPDRVRRKRAGLQGIGRGRSGHRGGRW